MTIPQRFVEAFKDKCPKGIWTFTVYDQETQKAKDYSYGLTQTWDLIDTMAVKDEARAIEILGYFGFVKPSRPKLKIVQDEDATANRFSQVEVD